MAVYCIMTIISCGFAFLASKSGDAVLTYKRLSISRAAIYLVLAAIPLVAVSGLRWKTGIDFQNYYWVFTNILYGLNTHVEIGFHLLCKLILVFTEDMAVMFFICALTTVGFTFLAIKRYSSNVLISVFLYISMGYFYYSMNSIRHYLALSIFLFAFGYLKRRKLVLYVICILVAACFHKIALVALPLYFVLNIKYRWYWYAILSGFLGVIFITHRQILDFIYRFVFKFYSAIEEQSVGISYVNIAIMLVLSVLAFIYTKPLLEKEKSNIILINSAYFGFIFFALCGWIPVYTRIGQYLAMLSLFLVPQIIDCEKNVKLKRVYIAGLFVGFSAFMVIILLNSKDPNIALLPYHSIFSR